MSGLGVSYLPPTENVAIFDSSLYNQNSQGLTYAEAVKKFLKYPLAQGDETLLNTVISGNLTINNNDNEILYTNSSSTNNIILTNTSNSISSGIDATQNIVIGMNNAGKILKNANSLTKGCIAIGDGSLGGLASTPSSSSDYPSYNVGVGLGSLTSLIAGSFSSINNIGLGTSSLSGLQYGATNVGIGYASGNYSVGTIGTLASNNVFIGSSSGVSSGTPNVSNSTVIGSNSYAGADSQVIIGSNILGNTSQYRTYIGSSGGSAQLVGGNIVGMSYQTYANGTNTTFSIPTSWFNSSVGITSSNAVVFTLPTINSDYYGIPLIIQNLSAYTITVNTQNTSTYVYKGKYGPSASGSMLIEAGSVFGYYQDDTTGDWTVFYKEQLNTISASSASPNYATNANIAFACIRLSYAGTQSITLPDLTASTSARLLNCWTTIVSDSAFNSTLSASNTQFTGIYGKQTGNNLVVYPYTAIKLYANSLTLNYEVVERFPATITLNYAYTGTPITLTQNEVDSIVNLSGSSTTTITLPSPTGNNWINGRFIKMYNNGSAIISVNSGSGNFTGSYGNGSTAINLPDNTWYSFTSNGTTWDINERSSNITYSNTISANVDYSNNANYTDATLRIEQTGGPWTITYPLPSTSTSHTTTSQIINTSNRYLYVFTSGYNWSGKYGSGTTTQIIPPNSFIEIYSDGTLWYVNERSPSYYEYFLGSSTLTLGNQALNSNISITAPDDNNALGGFSTPNLSGTATQLNSVFTVVSISAGTLSAGSVMAFNGVRMAIISQLTGTVGGIGTYIANVSQTVASATAWSNGYYNTSTVMVGTATQTAFSGSTTNLPQITLNTLTSGGNNLTNGSVLSLTTSTSSYQYITSQVSGTTGGVGVYYTTAINIGAITTQGFFATAGGRVNIPAPSLLNQGQQITITNNSFVPVNITTVAGSNIFGGQYGQQSYVGIGLTPPTNDTQYLLRIGKTVVLQSDGNNWNSIQGTSISGTKTFYSSGAITNVADGTDANIGAYNILNSNDSNLLGLQLSNTGNGSFFNNTNYPITIQLTANFTWATPSQATGTIISTRYVKITPGVNTVGGLSYTGQTSTQILNPVPSQILSAGTFTYSGLLLQTLSQTVSLQVGEGFFTRIGKYNNNGAQTETLTSAVLTIERIS